MIKELDIYRAAKNYIDEYGDEALFKAMHRVEKYRAIGNEQGMSVWIRITDAIQWMQISPKLVDTTCH